MHFSLAIIIGVLLISGLTTPVRGSPDEAEHFYSEYSDSGAIICKQFAWNGEYDVETCKVCCIDIETTFNSMTSSGECECNGYDDEY